MNNIGVILFDIDGVIRSVENSYRLSLKKTVYRFCGWDPSYRDIDNAKNEGIWNNDWDLSLELIKRHIKSENLKLKPPQSCLLYTSPSPRDLGKSRMPSSA